MLFGVKGRKEEKESNPCSVGSGDADFSLLPLPFAGVEVEKNSQSALATFSRLLLVLSVAFSTFVLARNVVVAYLLVLDDDTVSVYSCSLRSWT